MYSTTKDVVNAGVSQIVGPYDRNIGFQASRHSALYGKSNTNQSNALRLMAIVKFWQSPTDAMRCFETSNLYIANFLAML